MSEAQGVQGALRELGGVATWRELLKQCGDGPLRRAVAEGRIIRRGRGRYVATETSTHLATAHSVTATLSHLSAALEHGWKVKTVPEHAQVTVRRDRTIRPSDRRKVTPHWRDLPTSTVHRGVTLTLQTVLDCARDLPFDEALAVADSALREHDVTSCELKEAVGSLRGPGSLSARRVARHASAKPANPFESVLRAIALDIPELVGAVPQLQIWDSGLWATVDLAEPQLKLVLEADSWSEHGGRKAFRKDCRRYNNLVAWGWSVFRFTWEEVMFQPEYVTWCLVSWLSSRRGGKVAPPPPPLARFRLTHPIRAHSAEECSRQTRTTLPTDLLPLVSLDCACLAGAQLRQVELRPARSCPPGAADRASRSARSSGTECTNTSGPAAIKSSAVPAPQVTAIDPSPAALVVSLVSSSGVTRLGSESAVLVVRAGPVVGASR